MNATIPAREDLRAYRQRLQRLADRLSGNVAQLTAEATQPLVHPEQSSLNEGDEETARSLLRTEGDLLTEVRAALARIDAGTYGRCGRCGRVITKARLEAIPYAKRCAKCAAAEETEPR